MMAHAIMLLKCKKGHTRFNICYDSNECGCHHNGNPTIKISCPECFKEEIDKTDLEQLANKRFGMEISLSRKEAEIIERLLANCEEVGK